MCILTEQVQGHMQVQPNSALADSELDGLEGQPCFCIVKCRVGLNHMARRTNSNCQNKTKDVCKMRIYSQFTQMPTRPSNQLAPLVNQIAPGKYGGSWYQLKLELYIFPIINMTIRLLHCAAAALSIGKYPHLNVLLNGSFWYFLIAQYKLCPC